MWVQGAGGPWTSTKWKPPQKHTIVKKILHTVYVKFVFLKLKTKTNVNMILEISYKILLWIISIKL